MENLLAIYEEHLKRYLELSDDTAAQYFEAIPRLTQLDAATLIHVHHRVIYQLQQTLTHVDPNRASEFLTGVLHFNRFHPAVMPLPQRIEDIRNTSRQPLLEENRYHSLFEQSQDAIFIFDLHGSYIDINQSAADLLGYALEELRQKHAFEVITPAELDSAIQQRDVLLRGHPVATYQRTFIHKDGTPVTCEVSPALVQNDDGEPLYIQSIVRNISARLESEKRIQDQNRALRAANFELAIAKQELQESFVSEHELHKMKNRFVSMASHELRTPLAIIQATTETLRDYHDRIPPEKRQTRYTKIIQQVRRMRDIMQSVLTLGEIENNQDLFKYTSFDLSAFIDQLVSMMEPTCPSHAINMTLPDVPVMVEAAPELIERILSNLISNAVKYSPDANRIDISLTTGSQSTCITIRDYGIGIPQPYIEENLFDEFKRGSNVADIEGTGLGLIIVKQAVDLHNGSLMIDSTVGEGTTIIVHLPILICEEQRDNAELDQ